MAALAKIGITQSNVDPMLSGIKMDDDKVVNEEESGKEDSNENDGGSNNSDRGGQGLLFSMSDCDQQDEGPNNNIK